MVVHHWADRGEISAINRLGSVVLFDDKTGVDKFAVPRTTLTRLISSERWIPFAEMMPEFPKEGDTRMLVIMPHGAPEQTIALACQDFPEDNHRVWADRGGTSLGQFLAGISRTEFTHWRYLQPPRGIMLTTPIVEGAYYEREDGQVVGPSRWLSSMHLELWVGDNYYRHADGELMGVDDPDEARRLHLTRRVYLVPTDPAEVVGALREMQLNAHVDSHSEFGGRTDEAKEEAFCEAADLVAEKLGVES